MGRWFHHAMPSLYLGSYCRGSVEVGRWFHHGDVLIALWFLVVERECGVLIAWVDGSIMAMVPHCIAGSCCRGSVEVGRWFHHGDVEVGRSLHCGSCCRGSVEVGRWFHHGDALIALWFLL